MDSDGYTDEPVKLEVKLTINDEELLFDFTGSDEQRSGTRQFDVCTNPLWRGFRAQVHDRS